MRKLMTLLLLCAMLLPLSGCWLAAGAAGGYIYRDQQEPERNEKL